MRRKINTADTAVSEKGNTQPACPSHCINRLVREEGTVGLFIAATVIHLCGFGACGTAIALHTVRRLRR